MKDSVRMDPQLLKFHHDLAFLIVPKSYESDTCSARQVTIAKPLLTPPIHLTTLIGSS